MFERHLNVFIILTTDTHVQYGLITVTRLRLCKECFIRCYFEVYAGLSSKTSSGEKHDSLHLVVFS